MANYVYVMARMLHFTVAGKHGKRHTMRAYKAQGVSDWLNPHSL